MKPVLHSVVIAVAAGVVALLVTAIFLLPFVDVLDDTWQYELFKEQARHPSPINPSEVWRAVGATFIPYFGGASWYNLTTHYDIGMARVGSVILALALIGACQARRRREVWFLIALAMVALIAAWSAPPVTTLLRKVPLFAVAKNERLGFAAAFALSMLAAMAFDARDAVSRNRRLVFAVGAALAIATALLWRTRLDFGVQPKMMLIGAAAELLGIALLIAALSSRYRVAIVLVLAAIAAQRLAEDGFIYPAMPRRMFYPSTPILDAIPRDPLYRVVGTANLFIPNAASMFGLEDVRGYASMTYAPYKQTTRLWCPTSQRSYLDVTDLTLPFLSFLGVRHAITPRTMEPPPGWRVIADDRNTRLMENPRAIPRVFIPKIVRFMNSHETEMEEMLQATDFAGRAWIYSTEVMPQDVANGEAELQVRRVGSHYEIDVGARSACRIVITDVDWPGWRAYLDGRRVKISTANLAFLSVYVPEGTHHIRLVYLPDAFVRGRAVSFATILVLSAAIVVRRLRRKT
ncbi:MAG: YfhO family protein [Acidobacteriota bacterium]